MKKFFQFIGLLTLFCFSFYFTEKSISVIKEQDPIMIKINEEHELYKINPINALIENNTIIPGIYGKKVNIKESYNNMKQIGMYNDNLYIYDKVKPEITSTNNYNHYLSRGNNSKKYISIIFIVKNNKKLEELSNVMKLKDIKTNLFIESTYLERNINEFNLIKNNFEFNNYGTNNEYKDETIFIANNIIERISNKSKYCYTEIENSKTLKVCEDNKMHTIIPSLIIKENLYNEVKTSLNNGIIISIDLNKINITELGKTIDLIKQKGFKITPLSILLSEE